MLHGGVLCVGAGGRVGAPVLANNKDNNRMLAGSRHCFKITMRAVTPVCVSGEYTIVGQGYCRYSKDFDFGVGD